MRYAAALAVIACALLSFGCGDDITGPDTTDKPGKSSQTISNGVDIVIVICNDGSEVRKGETCPVPSPTPEPSPTVEPSPEPSPAQASGCHRISWLGPRPPKPSTTECVGVRD